MPVGAELKSRIRELLDLRFDRFYVNLEHGDPRMAEALSALPSSQEADYSHVLQSARRIREAVPHALSIDTLLDAHGHDTSMTQCGKLAIAFAILAAERASKLSAGGKRGGRPNHDSIQDSWLPRLFQMMTGSVPRTDVPRALQNVEFVIFNYDRCLERYLHSAMVEYYQTSEVDVVSALSDQKFIHPYGQVGRLEWQAPSPKVEFGGEPDARTLCSLSQSIRTFTERRDDEASVQRIRDTIANSETLVFLGFAFHPANMELMTPAGGCRAQRIFATAYGMSDYDARDVAETISSQFRPQVSVQNMHVRNDLTCHGLLGEYSRVLTSDKVVLR